MINDIIKILNLKGYDIDILRSYLEDSLSNKIRLHIYLNKRDLKCPYCGAKSKLKEYRIKEIKHSVFIDVECSIIFHNRRMVCIECDKTFMENNPFCFDGHKADIETEISILNQLKDYKMTFKKLSDLYHLSITTIIRIFDRRIQLTRHSFGEWVSMDEFYSRKISSSGYCLTFYDPIHKTVLDVISSRHKRILSDYLSRISLLERKRVQYVSIDMWETYKDVAIKAFPNCIVAVDSFHVIKHLNKALDMVRIRIMNKYKNNQEDDIGYYRLLKKFHYFFTTDISNIKFKPKKGSKYEYLYDKYGMLNKLLSIDEELKKAYELKELYREFNLCATYEESHELLQNIIDIFKTSRIKEYYPFISTLENWFPEICNSFKILYNKRLSNGPIESLNSRVKILLKNACGYSNFDRFKNRLMYSLNKNEPIIGYNNKNSYNRIGKPRGSYKKLK